MLKICDELNMAAARKYGETIINFSGICVEIASHCFILAPSFKPFGTGQDYRNWPLSDFPENLAGACPSSEMKKL